MGLFSRKKSLLGLDIGSSCVKALELTRVGQSLVITGMGKAEVESQENLPNAITKALHDSGIKTKR
ncbi:MAG: hypothetical protein ABSE73_26885, partial [Planctomycetota bacterium]